MNPKIAEITGVTVKGAEKATEAEKYLKTFLIRLQAAPDRAEAAEIMAGLMGDSAAVDKCATLARVNPGAWLGFTSQARAVRGMSRPVSDLERLVRARNQPIRVASPDESETYDAPGDLVPDGWEAPRGWQVRPDGIWRNAGDDIEQVTTRPVWVTGYYTDVDGHGHSIRLAWEQVDGSQTSQVVPSAVAADSRALVPLATDGLPVTSGNARHLAVYIDAATTTNRSILPLARVASRLGWMPGGFLMGRDWLGDESDPVYLTPDPGLQQIAQGYTVAGSFEGWVSDALGPAVYSPMAWISVYNAVASLLIKPLDLGDNWIIDRSGETSQGKSTLGKLAASVCGCPRKTIRPWKVSPAGIEAHCAILRHIPPIMDDSKKARKADDVAAIVYMHSGGQGAVRGKPGAAGRGVGIRAVETWQSAMDSSGEVPLTSFSQDAGARARVLCLIGSPLADGDTATRVVMGAEANYGHLARRVIGWLADFANLAWARETWTGQRNHWRDQLAPHGAVAGRLGSIVAALDLARMICEDVGLPAPPDGVDPISYAADCAAMGGRDADRPAEALRAAYDLAISRPTAFYGRHEKDNDGSARVPSTGWLGAWSPSRDWDHIAFTTTAMREVLGRAGFDAGIIDRWAERGWLDCNHGRMYRVRLDGSRVYAYRVNRKAFESAGCA